MPLSIDDIMRRFDAVCPQSPSIKFRPTLKPDDPRRWYMDLPRVSWIPVSGAGSGALCDFDDDGPTPEDALRNMWAATIRFMTRCPEGFMQLCTCPDNVPIPGDTPQAWVRWNIGREQWEDVVPTPSLLAAMRVPADRIFPYNSWEIRGRFRRF